jgi:Golgi nucleoside diphosphatase
MLIYIDADIQRLKSTATMNSNQCIQRYARETLCPICVSTSSSFNQINNDVNEPLCENDCRYLTKTCFNQTNNPYVAFASIAKGYSAIIKDIEQAIIELKVSIDDEY